MEDSLLQQTEGGLTYLAELSGSSVSSSMKHLACLAGGMFGLAGGRWLQLGEKITRTCHKARVRHYRTHEFCVLTLFVSQCKVGPSPGVLW